ncbi:MAG TPA: FHA domain-containing protein [Kofleriaceae bacterium]|nr:FHA domain-containing protein [Kofleriaceae bacterium]
MTSVQLRIQDSAARLDEANPRVLIGRDNTVCALVTTSASVSRRHAEVMLHQGQLWIRDLGSSNGTWVNGQHIGQQAVGIKQGDVIYVGQVPLGAEWQGLTGGGGGGGGKTQMVMEIPPQLKQLMEQHRQAATSAAPAQPAASVPNPAQPGGSLGLGGQVAPVPRELAYRRQGSNNNGSLLIALKGDTFANDHTIDGYLEFTALDNETIASVTIELIEYHRKHGKGGHVWDRMLVRQGPWKSRKGDVIPMPFQLRVPSGTSISGRDTWWEIKGYVDINWAFDVDAVVPINMRNLDLERIRDALGGLDLRIVDLESRHLGQRHEGSFEPPAQWAHQLGIKSIDLTIEYLGANVQVAMKVDKSALLKADRRVHFVFELAKLRSAPLSEISIHFRKYIDELMAMK